MGRYLIRRILFMILTLWIISVITFVIFYKLPAGTSNCGKIAQGAACATARRVAGHRNTPEQIAGIVRNLGLDQPWYVQYGRFAKGLVPWPGWFLNKQVYYSYSSFIPVKEEIYSRLPVTIVLTAGAAVVWLLIGIPIGIASAIRRRSLLDRSAMIFALFGVSAPIFWLGYVTLFVFWYKFGLHFLGSGFGGYGLWGAVLHGRFLLPWFVLSLAFAAFYARMVRGNLIETMNEDYIRTARAKGLSERRVIYKHGLRGALTPVVTMFGIDVGVLLGGAIITERVFGLPGIGTYTFSSIFSQNFPGVMGVTVFAAFFIVIANLIVDVAYAFLDPRVRYT